jgi:non-canonical (house-cleaning) NTP pyrophosphatase
MKRRALMPSRRPITDEEAVDDALEREAQALLKVQRMRFWLGVGGAGTIGFALGAFTTYQIACSLRPRR